MRDAGLQYRQVDGGNRVIIRGAPSTRLFWALPLQRSDGQLRKDASERLHRHSVDLGLNVAELIRQQAGYDPEWVPSSWTRLWLELIDANDPVAVLARWLRAEPRLRFHRLITTPALAGRRLFLRYIDGIMTGADPSVPPAGEQRPETARTEGLLEVGAAPLLAPSLLARNQPVVAILTTGRGAQVAATISEGHFVRPFTLDAWPVGMTQLPLEGRGQAIYRSDVQFPANWNTDILYEVVDAVDAFLDIMTDPARWITKEGRYDYNVRRLTWASLIYGFDAVSEMAHDWTARHTFWDAFRALGTLQSIWEGERQGAVGLAPLLKPHVVRNVALRSFPNEPHKNWASDIVHNYEHTLSSLSGGSDVDGAVDRLIELRHLIHGVYGQGGRRRLTRFEALQAMDEAEADIQLVRDIAAFWWSSVVFDPSNICTLGKAPWEG